MDFDYDVLPDDIKQQILEYDESSLCATSKATLAKCDWLWSQAVAAEKHYWENIYKVGDVVGVPEDNVRQDMRRYDKRRKGFARILDLIRRRDGVELKEDQISKHVSLRKAYLTLFGARKWAPQHWRADRDEFENLLELRRAFYDFEKGDDLRQAAVAKYGEPEAWIITHVTDLSSPDLLLTNEWAQANDDETDNYPGPEFNEPIGAWDTSSVKCMTATFRDFREFNQPIGAWDTSKVTNMDEMFSTATSFDQPIGDWKTGLVESMQEMFFNARTFNQPIGKWNTGTVSNMDAMFCDASNFNQPIGAWNTSIVNSISRMFSHATAFNQPISAWDTSEVEAMEQTFQNATSFNQPIASWNTSIVRDMEGMFEGAVAFNQPLCSWDTSQVRYMTRMFWGATAFNQPIGDWDLSQVKSVNDMFTGSAFDHDLFSNWSFDGLWQGSVDYIQRYTAEYRQRHASDAAGSAQAQANTTAAPTRLSVVDAVFAFHRIACLQNGAGR